jgi:hypothetical protein
MTKGSDMETDREKTFTRTSARNVLISEMRVALARNGCVLRPYGRAAWMEN